MQSIQMILQTVKFKAENITNGVFKAIYHRPKVERTQLKIENIIKIRNNQGT